MTRRPTPAASLALRSHSAVGLPLFLQAGCDVRARALLGRQPDPCPAAGVRPGSPDFGGRAAETLAELVDVTIPAVEAARGLDPVCRAICGYSLGGLFSLYAFVRIVSPSMGLMPGKPV